MRVMIVVTHLLGTGHLSRALTLGRAFQTTGHEVQVISGGMPVTQLRSDDLTLLQLPPLRSDGVNFSRLLTTDGALATTDVFEHRKVMLRNALHHTQPDVLITELFPFGRRNLRDEFCDLLTTAQSLSKPPMVFASIRDILAPPSKPAKATFADDIVAQFYDAVLVHSVEDVTPLELSWPVTSELAQKLIYTGFVAPGAPPTHPFSEGADEVLVSAGGGDVGADIFRAAKAAASQDPKRTWRILVGGQNASALVASLGKDAPANLRVEPARADFRQMLNHAAASVSMCGYNTALDVLQTGVPAVFIPFDAGGELEQGVRAKALSKQSAISIIGAAHVTPATLLTAVNQAIQSPPRAPAKTGFDGATRTVAIVEKRLMERYHT